MLFDHVIYATADLDAATERVATALGLTAVGGGEHEGMGTHNRLVPFGGGYVEILALVDPDTPPTSAIGTALAARLASHGDGPFAWAVFVDDVMPVAERLDTPVIAIARDGFSAGLTAVTEAFAEPFLPFFISRDPGVPAPGQDGPRIGALEVAGDADRLRAWLGELPDYLRVVPGADGVRAIAVNGRELR